MKKLKKSEKFELITYSIAAAAGIGEMITLICIVVLSLL